MLVKIKHNKIEKDIEVEDGSTISDALKKAEINPETVIVHRDGIVVTDSEKIRNKETIEVIRIISGG